MTILELLCNCQGVPLPNCSLGIDTMTDVTAFNVQILLKFECEVVYLVICVDQDYQEEVLMTQELLGL